MSLKIYIFVLTLCYFTCNPLAKGEKLSKSHNYYVPDTPLEHQFINFGEKCSEDNRPRITSVRAEGSYSCIEDEFGYTIIRTNIRTRIRLSGFNLNNDDIEIALTSIPGKFGDQCFPCAYNVIAERVDNYTAIAYVTINSSDNYYVCVNDVCDTHFKTYVHQGVQPWLTITSVDSLFPLWLQILLIITLLFVSSLLSGLNIGLLSLDKNELKVLAKCGTKVKKELARAILPVRQRSNYLLCSILLGNVLVNATVTVLLDDITTGVIAIVASTIGIVIFGEIIPTAVCSRHGLAIGGRTVFITYALMFTTFPISYPLSKILDLALGEEKGSVYDRESLVEYIRVTKDSNRLKPDEVNIISGALKLNRIKVIEIMTPIHSVYMLPIDATLDTHKINEISKSGYSRLPIYENIRTNVVAVLHVKDLIVINPNDNMHIKTLIDSNKRPVFFIYSDTTLDIILNEFKQGLPQMAFVRHVRGDHSCELVGVVTLKDVIEELIQSEINDETFNTYDRNAIIGKVPLRQTNNYQILSKVDVIQRNEKNISHL